MGDRRGFGHGPPFGMRGGPWREPDFGGPQRFFGPPPFLDHPPPFRERGPRAFSPPGRFGPPQLKGPPVGFRRDDNFGGRRYMGRDERDFGPPPPFEARVGRGGNRGSVGGPGSGGVGSTYQERSRSAMLMRSPRSRETSPTYAPSELLHPPSRPQPPLSASRVMGGSSFSDRERQREREREREWERERSRGRSRDRDLSVPPLTAPHGLARSHRGHADNHHHHQHMRVHSPSRSEDAAAEAGELLPVQLPLPSSRKSSSHAKAVATTSIGSPSHSRGISRERGSDRGTDRISDRGNDRTSEGGRDRVADCGSDRVSDRMSERGSDRAGCRGSDRVVERGGVWDAKPTASGNKEPLLAQHPRSAAPSKHTSLPLSPLLGQQDTHLRPAPSQSCPSSSSAASDPSSTMPSLPPHMLGISGRREQSASRRPPSPPLPLPPSLPLPPPPPLRPSSSRSHAPPERSGTADNTAKAVTSTSPRSSKTLSARHAARSQHRIGDSQTSLLQQPPPPPRTCSPVEGSESMPNMLWDIRTLADGSEASTAAQLQPQPQPDVWDRTDFMDSLVGGEPESKLLPRTDSPLPGPPALPDSLRAEVLARALLHPDGPAYPSVASEPFGIKTLHQHQQQSARRASGFIVECPSSSASPILGNSSNALPTASSLQPQNMRFTPSQFTAPGRLGAGPWEPAGSLLSPTLQSSQHQHPLHAQPQQPPFTQQSLPQQPPQQNRRFGFGISRRGSSLAKAAEAEAAGSQEGGGAAQRAVPAASQAPSSAGVQPCTQTQQQPGAQQPTDAAQPLTQAQQHHKPALAAGEAPALHEHPSAESPARTQVTGGQDVDVSGGAQGQCEVRSQVKLEQQGRGVECEAVFGVPEVKEELSQVEAASSGSKQQAEEERQRVQKEQVKEREKQREDVRMEQEQPKTEQQDEQLKEEKEEQGRQVEVEHALHHHQQQQQQQQQRQRPPFELRDRIAQLETEMFSLDRDLFTMQHTRARLGSHMEELERAGSAVASLSHTSLKHSSLKRSTAQGTGCRASDSSSSSSLSSGGSSSAGEGGAGMPSSSSGLLSSLASSDGDGGHASEAEVSAAPERGHPQNGRGARGRGNSGRSGMGASGRAGRPAVVQPRSERRGAQALAQSLMPAKLEAASYMQLSSAHTEPKLVQSSKEAAVESREKVLALLPDEMADNVRKALESGKPFTPLYKQPQSSPAWEANEASHEARAPGLAAHLALRAALVRAKQGALAAQYAQHVANLKRILAAGKAGCGMTQDDDSQSQMPATTPTGAGAPLMPTSVTRSSSRLCSAGSLAGMFGIARSDFDEQRIINNLQAVELLKDMSVLPDMELDPWQARWQAFDNRNGLNPDPVAEMEARRQSKQWSEAERKVFMDLFLQHPKEFRTISSALPGSRSQGDCVAFFYKHQKLDEWANVRRKQQLKKRKMNCDAKKHKVSPLVLAPLARARDLQQQQQQQQNNHPHGSNNHPHDPNHHHLFTRPSNAPSTSFVGFAPAPPPPPLSSGTHHMHRSSTVHTIPPGTHAHHSTTAVHPNGASAHIHGTLTQQAQAGARGGRGRGRGRTRTPQITPDLPQLPQPPPVQTSGPAMQAINTLGSVQGASVPMQGAPACGGAGGPLGGLTGLLLGEGDSNTQQAALYGNNLPWRSTPDVVVGAAGGSSDGGWTEGEYVECVRVHGRDFRLISRQLNMRTESTAKHFYYKNRHRLGLDQVLRDREEGLPGGTKDNSRAGTAAGGAAGGSETEDETDKSPRPARMGSGSAKLVVEGGVLQPPVAASDKEGAASTTGGGSKASSRPSSRGPKREEAAASLLAELQQQASPQGQQNDLRQTGILSTLDDSTAALLLTLHPPSALQQQQQQQQQLVIQGQALPMQLPAHLPPLPPGSQLLQQLPQPSSLLAGGVNGGLAPWLLPVPDADSLALQQPAPQPTSFEGLLSQLSTVQPALQQPHHHHHYHHHQQQQKQQQQQEHDDVALVAGSGHPQGGSQAPAGSSGMEGHGAAPAGGPGLLDLPMLDGAAIARAAALSAGVHGLQGGMPPLFHPPSVPSHQHQQQNHMHERHPQPQLHTQSLEALLLQQHPGLTVLGSLPHTRQSPSPHPLLPPNLFATPSLTLPYQQHPPSLSLSHTPLMNGLLGGLNLLPPLPPSRAHTPLPPLFAASSISWQPSNAGEPGSAAHPRVDPLAPAAAASSGPRLGLDLGVAVSHAPDNNTAAAAAAVAAHVGVGEAGSKRCSGGREGQEHPCKQQGSCVIAGAIPPVDLISSMHAQLQLPAGQVEELKLAQPTVHPQLQQLLHASQGGGIRAAPSDNEVRGELAHLPGRQAASSIELLLGGASCLVGESERVKASRPREHGCDGEDTMQGGRPSKRPTLESTAAGLPQPPRHQSFTQLLLSSPPVGHDPPPLPSHALPPADNTILSSDPRNATTAHAAGQAPPPDNLVSNLHAAPCLPGLIHATLDPECQQHTLLNLLGKLPKDTAQVPNVAPTFSRELAELAAQEQAQQQGHKHSGGRSPAGQEQSEGLGQEQGPFKDLVGPKAQQQQQQHGSTPAAEQLQEQEKGGEVGVALKGERQGEQQGACDVTQQEVQALQGEGVHVQHHEGRQGEEAAAGSAAPEQISTCVPEQQEDVAV